MNESGRAREDELVELQDRVVVLGRHDPVMHGGLAVAGELQFDLDDGIHAALRDRVAAEDAVLGVAERALEPRLVLGAGREGIDAAALRPAAVAEEVAVALVMDHRARRRVEIRRVAHVVAEDAEVLVEVQPRHARRRRKVPHDDALQVDVEVEIHRVRAVHLDLHRGVAQAHARDQRLLFVGDRARPAVVVDPAQPAVHPDAEVERLRPGVVLLADMRKIEIADPVATVERDEHVAVADGNIARHRVPPSRPVPPSISLTTLRRAMQLGFLQSRAADLHGAFLYRGRNLY